MASILVLEDSPTVSDPLRSLLESDGHEVAVCQDAASAMAFIDRNRALDLALVDYWLEHGTSESVLATLHDKRPDVRVVLITGGSRDVSVETTQWLGALDVNRRVLAKAILAPRDTGGYPAVLRLRL